MAEIRRVYRGDCDHCGAEDDPLARLAVSRPDGIKQIMMVCRDCYVRLRSRRT
jgi:hypothetical protein